MTDDLRELCRAELARASALRMALVQSHPFWGYLLLQVRLLPSPELSCIAATDCIHHIWFNPHLTAELSHDQLGFVLAHEVGHQLFVSEDRRRGRNRHLWNCATDYAINRIVSHIEHPGRRRTRRYEPIEGILLDPRYDDMIAEAIYEYLVADALPQPVSVSLTLGDGSDGEAVQIPNLSDHGGGLDVHLPTDLSPAQRQEVADRIAAAVGHWHGQGRRGNVPGSLVRSFHAQRPATLPWQVLLRRFVQAATAKDDYSLARPNRRYLAQDLVVPGLSSEKAGHVVIAMDTSGSMSQEQLDAVGAEIRQIASAVEQVTLIVADASVQKVVGPDDLERFLQSQRAPGGGGTDHRPVFAWITENGIQPDVFIGLTDLFSRFPERAPSYPVLWVAPARRGQAPWGKVLTP